MKITRKGKRKLKRAALQGLIVSSGVAAIIFFMHGQMNPSVASEADDVDMRKICYVDDSPHMKPEHYQATPEIPLMYLDKQSDAEVDIPEDEVLAIYHGFPFAMPNPKVDDRRNPIGKWVGRGLLDNHKLYNNHSEYFKNKFNKSVCNVDINGVDEPNSLTLILVMVIYPLITYLRRRKNEITSSDGSTNDLSSGG